MEVSNITLINIAKWNGVEDNIMLAPGAEMSDANNCSVIFLLLLSFLLVKHFMSIGVH